MRTQPLPETHGLRLAGLSYVTCLVYLDDIIIFGRSFEEKLSRLGINILAGGSSVQHFRKLSFFLDSDVSILSKTRFYRITWYVSVNSTEQCAVVPHFPSWNYRTTY